MKIISKMRVAWAVAAAAMIGIGGGYMWYCKDTSDRLLRQAAQDYVRGTDLNEILKPVIDQKQKLSVAESEQLLINKFADKTLKPRVVESYDGPEDSLASLGGVSVTLDIVAAEVVRRASPEYDIDPQKYPLCVVYIAKNILSTEIAYITCGKPGGKIPQHG